MQMNFFNHQEMKKLLETFTSFFNRKKPQTIMVRIPRADGSEVHIKFPLHFTIKEAARAAALEFAGRANSTYELVEELVEEAIAEAILKAWRMDTTGARKEGEGFSVWVYWVK